ncbi:MAG: hypothetical protein HY040_11580 [Planctomycetes bacterium]|nr:hypothetical protein [Planctomycetota bacterium]
MRTLGMTMACLLTTVAVWQGAQAGETGKNATLAARKLKVLVVEGEPHARGVMHGKAMKEEIHKLLKLWKADLGKGLKMDADEFVKLFVKKTDFLAAMKKWTPDLIEEIAGIAEGAGVDHDTIFVFQLPDEVWANGQDIVLKKGSDPVGLEGQTPFSTSERCSCLGFSRKGDRPAYVAQNLDLPPFHDGFQMVLHVKEKDTEAFVLTVPGLIALNGMNNKSVAICCNTLLQLNSCHDGLPVACIIRGVLRQKSEEEAVAFLRRVQHASGQNYVLGGPEKAWDFECSANAVSQFTPKGQDSAVWHTNHPLVSNDFRTSYKAYLKKSEALDKILTNTRTRLQCLESRLSDKSLVPGLDLIKTTLRSKDSAACPVCRSDTKKGAFTFASTIAVLSSEPELYVAPGPPDRDAYEKLTFSTRPK